jgi:hypothetical protein
MFILDGKTLPVDVPFTHNDIQYPANWLRLATLEEKQAIGITEEPDPVAYDDRFYWGVDNPKTLEDTFEDQEIEGETVSVKVGTGLKTQWVHQVKDTANKLMAPTDWMVLRQLFKGIGMSALVENYRDAVVAEANRLETAILATTTVEELITVVSTQNWPKTP